MATQTELREKRFEFRTLAHEYFMSGMNKTDIKKALAKFKFSDAKMNGLMIDFHLCETCSNYFATCTSKPKFIKAKTRDNIIKCDSYFLKR